MELRYQVDENQQTHVKLPSDPLIYSFAKWITYDTSSGTKTVGTSFQVNHTWHGHHWCEGIVEAPSTLSAHGSTLAGPQGCSLHRLQKQQQSALQGGVLHDDGWHLKFKRKPQKLVDAADKVKHVFKLFCFVKESKVNVLWHCITRVRTHWDQVRVRGRAFWPRI